MGHIECSIYTCLKHWTITILDVLAFFSCFPLGCSFEVKDFLDEQIFHNPIKLLFSLLSFSLAGINLDISVRYLVEKFRGMEVHDIY